MAHTYTPSKDAILTVQDAAKRIVELEERVEELEKYADSNEAEISKLLERFEKLEHAASLNAHTDKLRRTGAVDDTEGPMNPEHLEYGY